MMDSIWFWAWGLLPTWIVVAALFVMYVCPRLFRFVEDDDE